MPKRTKRITREIGPGEAFVCMLYVVMFIFAIVMMYLSFESHSHIAHGFATAALVGSCCTLSQLFPAGFAFFKKFTFGVA